MQDIESLSKCFYTLAFSRLARFNFHKFPLGGPCLRPVLCDLLRQEVGQHSVICKEGA